MRNLIDINLIKDGQVPVTINGETRLMKITREADGKYIVPGFLIRYQTGTKLWRSSIVVGLDGAEYLTGGMDARSKRYSMPKLVGFYNP